MNGHRFEDVKTYSFPQVIVFGNMIIDSMPSSNDGDKKKEPLGYDRAEHRRRNKRISR